DIIQYAQCRAQIDATGSRDGLPVPAAAVEDGWARWQKRQLLSLADALERGDVAQIETYRTAYEEAYATHGGVSVELPVDGGHAAASSPPSAAAPSSVPSPAPSPDETSFLAAAIDLGPALPFTPAPPGAIIQPSSSIPLPRDPAGETGVVDLAALDLEPLPFSAPADAASEARPNPTDGLTDEASIDETAAITVLPDPATALPFSGTNPAPPPTFEPAAAPPARTGATALVPLVADDELALPPPRALPFSATTRGRERVDAAQPTTVQQLAAIEVELARAGGQIPRVLAHFGLDVAGYRALRGSWSQRTADDPSLAQVLDEEKEAYANWRNSMPS
ncbi:MAG: hypothetical protein AAGN82_28725, partial [Myxococcota bacterium]